MRNFAVLIAALGFFASAVAQQLNIPSLESGNHRAHCAEEWTKRGVLDQGMFNYCMNKESKGYHNLVTLANEYRNMTWIQAAVDYSLKKWTKRGVRQDSMVHYQLNKITEGYEDLVYMSKQPGWDKAKHDSCSRQWGVDFQMVVFCYKKSGSSDRLGGGERINIGGAAGIESGTRSVDHNPIRKPAIDTDVANLINSSNGYWAIYSGGSLTCSEVLNKSDKVDSFQRFEKERYHLKLRVGKNSPLRQRLDERTFANLDSTQATLRSVQSIDGNNVDVTIFPSGSHPVKYSYRIDSRNRQIILNELQCIDCTFDQQRIFEANPMVISLKSKGTEVMSWCTGEP